MIHVTCCPDGLRFTVAATAHKAAGVSGERLCSLNMEFSVQGSAPDSVGLVFDGPHEAFAFGGRVAAALEALRAQLAQEDLAAADTAPLLSGVS